MPFKNYSQKNGVKATTAIIERKKSLKEKERQESEINDTKKKENMIHV